MREVLLLILALCLIGLAMQPPTPQAGTLEEAVPALKYAGVPEWEAEELECAVKTVFGEARGESFEGQFRVALVMFNRAKHGAWGYDLCQVARAKNQFAGYWAAPSNYQSLPEHAKVRASVLVAYLAGGWLTEYSRVLYFAGVSERSGFHARLKVFDTVGGHRFYLQPNL